jgi:hypothetical protein
MTVTKTRYGKWTSYVGTLAEISAALNVHIAQPDKTWTFSNGATLVSVVYGG